MLNFEKMHSSIGISLNFFMREVSPLNCCANQWTDFYMIGTTVMKELSLPMLGNYFLPNDRL